MTEPTENVIGGWYIEIDEQWRTNSPLVLRLCQAAEIACSILAQHGILLPKYARIRSWIEESANGFTKVDLGELGFEMHHHLHGEPLWQTIEEFAASKGHPAAIPEIMVSGETELIQTSDTSVYKEGVCELTLLYDGVGLAALLHTRSTAWLQYDLSGDQQHDLANKNAPRLARALHELGDAFGSVVTPMEPTRYALSTPSGLENHHDVAGNILPIRID